MYNKILELVIFTLYSLAPQGRFMGISTLLYQQRYDLLERGGIIYLQSLQ
jgi:hypothetical protein